jgi:hypothetical protein
MIMDDDLAGKGTRTARNASTVDGWNCVGNPGGIYSETGEFVDRDSCCGDLPSLGSGWGYDRSLDPLR